MKAFSLFVVMLAIAGAANARELNQHFSSGGSCSAHADASSLKTAHDGFAEACAVAWKYGCSNKCTGDELVKKMTETYETCASVLVKVCVEAAAKCKTYGNAWGCASAYAEVDKQADAIIALYSHAAAYAKNVCTHCDPTASAEVFASLVVELFASAKASVKAYTCSYGNMSTSSKAVASCYASVLAHGIARAHAVAMIKGGCTDTNGQLAADALAQVKNTVDADPQCACTGWARACVNGHCDYKYSPPADYVKGKAEKCPYTAACYKAECEAYAVQLV